MKPLSRGSERVRTDRLSKREIFLTGARPFADMEIVRLWKIATAYRSTPPKTSMEIREHQQVMRELNEFRVPQLAPQFQRRTVKPWKEETQFGRVGMRFMNRHGPDLKLYADEGGRSLEGRLLGGWPGELVDLARPFYRWEDRHALEGAINRYLYRNWETARVDLARFGRHAGKICAADYGLLTLGVGLTIERGVLKEITTENAVLQLDALLSSDARWFVKTAYPV